MERNQTIGLVIISAMMMVYLFINSSNEPAVQAQNIAKTEQTQTQELNAASTTDSNLLVSTDTAPVISEKTTKIVTQELTVEISNIGAKIQSVLLNNYTDHLDNPLYIIQNGSSNFQIKGSSIDLSDIVFESNSDSLVKVNDNSKEIVFSTADGTMISYVFHATGFQVGYAIHSPALRGLPTTLTWDYEHQVVENNTEYNRTRTGISYYTTSGDFDTFGEGGSSESETLKENVKWITHKQRFFLSAIIANNTEFEKPQLATSVEEDNLDKLKFSSFQTNFVAQEDNAFQFYFGPIDYTILKEVTDGFNKNVYLGWSIFGWVNRFLVIPIFKFLEQYISNYGVIILCLVLIIKLLLFPIAYKSYLSMAKMKELKPEIDAIKERVGDDMAKQQQETMKLYSKAGVSPLSGCIPMLLQMPVLFALFNFFPNSIELRHEPFLWAKDLSTYDDLIRWTTTIPLLGNHLSIFTVLMTLSTIGYTYYNNQINSSAMQGPMKTMGYIMPVAFLFFLNSFAAGLTFYYFVSNLVTIAQQLLATRFIDKEKIRQTIEENKKNYESGKSKKSKFQQRLDEAMKASQEAAKKNKK